jgi:hypothetical protein
MKHFLELASSVNVKNAFYVSLIPKANKLEGLLLGSFTAIPYSKDALLWEQVVNIRLDQKIMLCCKKML